MCRGEAPLTEDESPRVSLETTACQWHTVRLPDKVFGALSGHRCPCCRDMGYAWGSMPQQLSLQRLRALAPSLHPTLREPAAMRRREPEQFTLESLAAWTGVPPGRMQHYVEYGLIEPIQHAGSQGYLRSLRFQPHGDHVSRCFRLGH